MRRVVRIPTLLLSCTALAAAAHAAEQKLGEVEFEMSCTAAAQAPFERGLLLLHHMMYRQSAAAFEEAAAADPACAMAQWGIAMTKFHPLWPGGPTPEETAAGRAAADRLGGMDPGTAREAGYADAVLAFYEGEDVPYRARLAAWASAQRALAEEHPDDPDARAFASLAQMTVAPRGAEAVPELIESGERMDALRAEAPGHPGAYHYAIHAYDHPALAERGLEVSRAYLDIAPEVPHALHMPTHIFTRLGLWEEAVELNLRSAAAVLDQSGDDVIVDHYPHAVDYAVYAHLQLGRPDEARKVLADMETHDGLEDTFGTAYAAAAAPARIPLETGDWAAAAALPAELHPAVTWDRYPQAVAIRWFAKGLGAARAGDAEAARAALGELEALGEVLRERDARYWLALLEAQTKAIRAWTAMAENDPEAAIALMREAAEIEDGVGKAPVTPGHVLPARELLGDLLREAGRTDEAAEAYEASLATAPNRSRSLAGLAAVAGQ
jgi:tetratricopeptide (TPR) repeat protein